MLSEFMYISSQNSNTYVCICIKSVQLLDQSLNPYRNGVTCSETRQKLHPDKLVWFGNFCNDVTAITFKATHDETGKTGQTAFL